MYDEIVEPALAAERATRISSQLQAVLTMS
jgi:hypothetical protein